MCGILGAFNRKIPKDILIRCIDMIKHRGPDDRGIWQDSLCSLAHRRLSILDLSEAGKQPMQSANGRFCIIFNGEIYNFLELRNELKLKGYEFKSDADTEVVLNAYIEWKEKCLEKFNGMWALAIYDSVEETVFLSRDRFGIKPLYYAEDFGGIIFASEMKAIIPLLSKATPNYNILKDINSIFCYESTQDCLINEIRRLPAGSYAVINKDGIKVTRWWNTLEHLQVLPQSYEEQVDIFKELFLDACRIRMRSDVPIGTALSGGLDSSATICAMAAIAGKRREYERINRDFQHAYIASFPQTMFDEDEYAKKVTDYLDIANVNVIINPEDGITNMEDYIYKFEEIYATSPVPMMQLYGRMRSDGITVTLDGHGADELFGGYTFDMLYALLDAGVRKDSISQILMTYFEASGYSGRDTGKYIQKYVEFVGKHLIKKVLHVPTLDELKYVGEDKRTLKRMGHFERALYNATHYTVLPTILRNYDRYSMASGVEIRMPFMDYRIVEFAFSVNWQAKMQGGYSKKVIRDALREIMPSDIVNRKSKIGFNTPIVEWIKGPWKGWILDIINSVEFKQSNFINANQVKNYFEKIINEPAPNYEKAERAWMLLMPYLWEKYFYKSHKVLKLI